MSQFIPRLKSGGVSWLKNHNNATRAGNPARGLSLKEITPFKGNRLKYQIISVNLPPRLSNSLSTELLISSTTE